MRQELYLGLGEEEAGAVSGEAQGVGAASGRPRDEVAPARHQVATMTRRAVAGGRARAGTAGVARAARPARRAGPGRSTMTRGGARGRGTAGDGGGGARGRGTAGDGGGGERRSEFCEVWERRDLWGECSVSAG